MKEKSIYELDLFEEKIIFNNNTATEAIKRVPGGWMYTLGNSIGITSSFIPMNTEFE